MESPIIIGTAPSQRKLLVNCVGVMYENLAEWRRPREFRRAQKGSVFVSFPIEFSVNVELWHLLSGLKADPNWNPCFRWSQVKSMSRVRPLSKKEAQSQVPFVQNCLRLTSKARNSHVQSNYQKCSSVQNSTVNKQTISIHSKGANFRTIKTDTHLTKAQGKPLPRLSSQSTIISWQFNNSSKMLPLNQLAMSFIVSQNYLI